jgi:hypothetical protein
LWRRGTFPAPVIDKPRARLWRRSDVEEWARTAHRRPWRRSPPLARDSVTERGPSRPYLEVKPSGRVDLERHHLVRAHRKISAPAPPEVAARSSGGTHTKQLRTGRVVLLRHPWSSAGRAGSRCRRRSAGVVLCRDRRASARRRWLPRSIAWSWRG